MNTKEIVLASASPRRHALLQQIGLRHRVVPYQGEERFDEKLSPEKIVEQLALLKATTVAQKEPGDLFIGADTIVYMNEILGKPKDEKDAYRMLCGLSGKWHFVYTGVALYQPNGTVFVSHEKTRVQMKPLSDEEIYAYIRTKEPLDKAGAYGIQGLGAMLVSRVEGCYYTVVGLPLKKLGDGLKQYGLKIF